MNQKVMALVLLTSLLGMSSDVDAKCGPAGPRGATGAPGAPGANGIIGYGYVYNIGAQTVGALSAVPFSNSGPLSTGITHTAGSTAIVVANAGVYAISFSVSGTAANEFSIEVDGISVASNTYGTTAVGSQNTGFVIVAVPAGGSITLVNVNSTTSVTLPATPGGTATGVNASILIEQVA